LDGGRADDVLSSHLRNSPGTQKQRIGMGTTAATTIEVSSNITHLLSPRGHAMLWLFTMVACGHFLKNIFLDL
jgi:hypothetical protein